MYVLTIVQCSLHFLIDSGYRTVSEELLKLQGSLVSLKCACKNSEVKEENRKIILPIIDCSLTESCSVAWVARYAKHAAVMRNESLLQKKKAFLKNVNELQRKGSYTHMTACNTNLYFFVAI